MKPAGKRIFQIGLNRCGTTSLYELFKSSGIPSLHWDSGRIARSFFSRMERKEDPFLDYPENVFFSDMMAIVIAEKKILEAHKHFDYIFEFYPDSYYTLNTRSCENWLKSRWNHLETRERYRECTGLERAGLMDLWRRDWHEHHAQVQDFFSRKGGKLAVFDIERDPAEKLARFVAADFRVDPSFYGRHNPSGPSFARRALRFAKRKLGMVDR
jgi:hypothetical protein